MFTTTQTATPTYFCKRFGQWVSTLARWQMKHTHVDVAFILSWLR